MNRSTFLIDRPRAILQQSNSLTKKDPGCRRNATKVRFGRREGANMVRFLVIVPALNCASSIDRCLAGLLATQPGTFDLHVHVQDGGSSDATVQIATEWCNRVGSSKLTIRQESDDGLYDAIAKAARLIETDQIMTWLGADDVLMPGALATVASIFAQQPTVQWLTGLALVANEAGETYTPWPPLPFVRHELAAGHYDGRTLGFIMQEGTFWRSSLWHAVGGVDKCFKYAGDWDLWRRFAQHTPLYAVTFPLARFSRRSGQLSGDLTAYYREVDAAPLLPPVYDYRSHQLVRWPWATDWEILVKDHLPAISDSQQTMKVD